MEKSVNQGSELCPKCLVNKATTRKSRLCHACFKKENPPKAEENPIADVLRGLAGQVKLARSTEDWQKLWAAIEPVYLQILSGSIGATAAQATLLSKIQDRAFGRPVATQAEKRIASGVIVLPALGSGEKMTICPKCGFDIMKDLEK